MKNQYEPVIKWSGSKRAVANLLSSLFPATQRFFDPFVGSGAILPYRPASNAQVGDIIPELIALWQLIQKQPDEVGTQYALRWQRLQDEGHTAYYAIRENFNTSRDPHDFLFLTRTCVNGLIRFNSDGGFNNSLHHTRPGIAPSRLRTLLTEWSSISQGISFECLDYRETLSFVREGDVVFLDPPYAGNKGRYGKEDFDVKAFFQELERLNCIGTHWVLTFDGTAGTRVYEGGVPSDLYRQCLPLYTGNSPFTKMMKTGVDAVVESVYFNFDPSPKTLAKFENLSPYPLGSRGSQDMQNTTISAPDKLNPNHDVNRATL